MQSKTQGEIAIFAILFGGALGIYGILDVLGYWLGATVGMIEIVVGATSLTIGCLILRGTFIKKSKEVKQ